MFHIVPQTFQPHVSFSLLRPNLHPHTQKNNRWSGMGEGVGEEDGVEWLGRGRVEGVGGGRVRGGVGETGEG